MFLFNVDESVREEVSDWCGKTLRAYDLGSQLIHLPFDEGGWPPVEPRSFFRVLVFDDTDACLFKLRWSDCFLVNSDHERI